jgi:hypothetical protein
VPTARLNALPSSTSSAIAVICTASQRDQLLVVNSSSWGRTPHLLAGRSGREDPPHPMWLCLAQAPGDGRWQRARSLVAAAGCVTGPSDPQFQSLVAERVAAGDPERGDSPAYLLKRLKQLEQEDATLRQNKRSRPEDAAAELKRADHRAQAPVLRGQVPRAVCRGARPPERADRGCLGPRLVRPGPEHRGRKARRSSAASCSPPSPRGAVRRRCSPTLPLGAPGSRGPPTPHALRTRSSPPSAPRAGPRTRPRS